MKSNLLLKKEEASLKKKIKDEKKKTRQIIIDKHINICFEMIDESYNILLKEIEDFNLELVSMSENIKNKSNELEKYISLDDTENIKKNIKETFEISDKYFKRVSDYITPGGRNSITRPLVDASKKLNKYLNNLETTLTLSKNKNATYITSLVFTTAKKRSDEYCKMVCDDFYDNNEYFKALEYTYYDYEEIIKTYRRNLIKEKRLNDESEIENIPTPKEICCQGRLRITHTDMMDFAKAMGFEEDRQSSSTHRVFKNHETGVSVPIPAKKGKDMPQGTMSMLLKQMGFKRKDLAKFLSK